jgi:hypothetical protein
MGRPNQVSHVREPEIELLTFLRLQKNVGVITSFVNWDWKIKKNVNLGSVADPEPEPEQEPPEPFYFAAIKTESGTVIFL